MTYIPTYIVYKDYPTILLMHSPLVFIQEWSLTFLYH